MAVQVTVVTPIGNMAPFAGEQDTVVGGVPPVAIALPYETAVGCPDGDSSDTGAGQEALGPTYTRVGCPGDALHPSISTIPGATASAVGISRRAQDVRRTGALTHYGPSAKRVKMGA